MPWLIVPAGAYLWGRFVDGDNGIPWTRIAVIAVSIALVVYMVRGLR